MNSFEKPFVWHILNGTFLAFYSLMYRFILFSIFHENTVFQIPLALKEGNTLENPTLRYI